MESMPPSMGSIESMESADYASGVSAGGVMMKDMPLEEQPMDPERAHEHLAQRVTEDTGSGGDPHLHAEREGNQMANETTEDTGAEGDMQTHADRKVD